MKLKSIKTLIISGKEWFDRSAGNSYHSVRYTVNFGMKSEKSFAVPFGYGYGDSYLQSVAEDLAKRCGVTYREVTPFHHKVWRVQSSIETGCRKAEVMKWGEA